MSKQLEELKLLFPTSKEIKITNKTILVKPMVWTDFLAVIEDFGKIINELFEKNGFDLTKFDEKKDMAKLVPVIKEVINIFSGWLKVEPLWLKDNLTMKGTMELLVNFLDVNEWDEVKSLFLALKLKVQTLERK